MPLKSRLTSPARDARAAEAPSAPVAAPREEPTTSPRRRTAAPVESENLAKDIVESSQYEGLDEAPATAGEPEPEGAEAGVEGTPGEPMEQTFEEPTQPAPRKRGPKPGSKRAAVRRIVEPEDPENAINVNEVKSQMKQIEVEAKELTKDHQNEIAELQRAYQTRLHELSEKHKYLATQLSAAVFGL